MEHRKTFRLTEREAQRVRRSHDRLGYIAVLEFGPRYRGRRGEVAVTATDARRWANDQLANPRYRPAPSSAAIYMVDAFGRGIEVQA